MKYSARCLIILLAFCFALPALATVRNVVSGYGAVGNGTHDDTANINNAIAAMVPGDELFFPCPSAFFLITSGLHVITSSNVTIDGQTGCPGGGVMIKASGTGFYMMQIGSISLSASTQLTASSPELSNTITANFSAVGGLAAGDYVRIKEGSVAVNSNPSNYDDDGMECSISGCRSEILKIASVSSNTATVTTALHNFYDITIPTDPAQSWNTSNVPIINKLLNPQSGVTIHDLILDGGGDGCETSCGVVIALQVMDNVNLTASNLTLRGVQNNAFYSEYGFNNSFNNINMSYCSNNYNYCWIAQRWGHMTINGLTVNKVNFMSNLQYTAGDNGFANYEGADGTFSNITVDKAPIVPGQYVSGRGWKYNATRYVTCTGCTIKNTPVIDSNCPTGCAGGTTGGGANGMSLEYFSAHNTFNNCTVLNNGGDGVAGWGEFDTNNTFNGCTMYGNGIYQMAIHGRDDGWEINGGNYTGRSGTNDIAVWTTSEVINNTYIHNAAFSGAGSGTGLQLNGSNECVNSNTFSGFSTDISIVSGSNNLGSGNTTPDGISGLTEGTCGSSSSPPAPPGGLTATVQ